MPLILNEEQQQLKDSVKSFIEDQWELNQLRQDRESPKNSSINAELWQQMVDLGSVSYTHLTLPTILLV